MTISLYSDRSTSAICKSKVMSNLKDTMRNILLFTFIVNAIPINVITQLPLFIAIRLCKITTWHWRGLAIRFRWAAELWISEIPHEITRNQYYITLNGYNFSNHWSYNLASTKKIISLILLSSVKQNVSALLIFGMRNEWI